MLRRSIAGLFVPLLYLVPVLGQDAMQYHVRQLKIVAQDSKVTQGRKDPHAFPSLLRRVRHQRWKGQIHTA